MVGAPFAAILSDRFGRRKAMFCGGVVIIVGMIIVATSNVTAQFVVGRFILGYVATRLFCRPASSTPPSNQYSVSVSRS